MAIGMRTLYVQGLFRQSNGSNICDASTLPVTGKHLTCGMVRCIFSNWRRWPIRCSKVKIAGSPCAHCRRSSSGSAPIARGLHGDTVDPIRRSSPPSRQENAGEHGRCAIAAGETVRWSRCFSRFAIKPGEICIDRKNTVGRRCSNHRCLWWASQTRHLM